MRTLPDIHIEIMLSLFIYSLIQCVFFTYKRGACKLADCKKKTKPLDSFLNI